MPGQEHAQAYQNKYKEAVKGKMKERGIETRGPKSKNVHGAR